MNQQESTQASAQFLAQRVAEYIQYNSIDVTKIPMDVIVKEFFLAQIAITEDAGIKALGFLS